MNRKRIRALCSPWIFFLCSFSFRWYAGSLEPASFVRIGHSSISSVQNAVLDMSKIVNTMNSKVNKHFSTWGRLLWYLPISLSIESICELSNFAYISSCWSNSVNKRLIVWFFRWKASMKYVCTFFASLRSSTHLIFRRTVLHSWLILAIFKRVNASSRFNLFCNKNSDKSLVQE